MKGNPSLKCLLQINDELVTERVADIMSKIKRLIGTVLIAAMICLMVVPAGLPGDVYAASLSSDFEDELLAAYGAWDASIDITSYGIKVDEISSVLNEFWHKHPEEFHVNRAYSCSYNPTSRVVTKLTLSYCDAFSKTGMREYNRAYATAVKDALSQVKSGMSDMEKALVLHDYLALNCVYDQANYAANTVPAVDYTAYGALVDHLAVCQGYALAYQDLCNRAGLECIFVDSDAMAHAWNEVKIDGVWYHVDVTWDDPVPDMIGRVNHDNFLRSDSGIASTGHSGWALSGVTNPGKAAPDTRYDSGALWDGTRTQIVYTAAGKYCKPEISGKGSTSQKLSIKTEAGKTLASFNTQWRVDGKSNSYWTDNYSALAYANNLLLVNDASRIYSVNPSSGKTETVFTYSGSEGSIYGIALQHGKLAYLVSKAPDKAGKLYYIELPSGNAAVVTDPTDPIPVPTVTVPQDAENPFKDVLKGTYFYDAALWAYYNGITTGTSEDTFSPAGTCDRGQTLTFLWRASGSPEPTINTNPFYDVKPSDYYYKAVLWGVGKGITTGTSEDTFSPKNRCTQAQVLTFTWRANGEPEPSNISATAASQLGDTYYKAAFAWAEERGMISAGFAGKTSNASTAAPRCDIVTYLYKNATNQ